MARPAGSRSSRSAPPPPIEFRRRSGIPAGAATVGRSAGGEALAAGPAFQLRRIFRHRAAPSSAWSTPALYRFVFCRFRLPSSGASRCPSVVIMVEFHEALGRRRRQDVQPHCCSGSAPVAHRTQGISARIVRAGTGSQQISRTGVRTIMERKSGVILPTYGGAPGLFP